MKNLKKVLALVLVIAMVMGFAVSASAAEFSDADQVAEQNQTAVEVLSALNIINGFTDGTYRPEASVTRAQVAKMLAVAFNEGDESINDLYRNAPTTLTDISGTWAEGYIKYMANVGYINGFPDGTYRPDDAVTANQLCQIMLNILGYDIDTTVSWATAVQAKSFSIGLLKNVSTAVGSDCPRQEAAQIIYNALNMDLLEENALGVKVASGETILTKYLNGYTATVVVTGNEYASLTGDSPLAAGKTQVNNKTTLNWSTDLDAIGETYTIWATKGGAQNNDTVIYASNAGLNEIEEVNTDTALSRAVSLTLGDDTAYFINFGDGETYTASDYKIKYVVTDVDEDTAADLDALKTELTEANAKQTQLTLADGVYTRVIKVGEKITATDRAVLKLIFNTGDLTIEESTATYAVGEVYIGTQSTKDISDEISYKDFLAKYTDTTKESTKITANVQGDYTKVIDNDGDGVADYVLQTQYALAEIATVKTRGADVVYTFVNDAYADYSDSVVPMYEDAAAGDVVVSALIDGVVYLYESPMTTETVKTYSYAKDTITTTDGNTYEQSDIDNTTEYANKIATMNDQVEYEIFFDLFGNVAAYRLVDSTTKFALLTEAYTTTTNNGQYIKNITATVEAKLGDADLAEYNVTNYNTRETNYNRNDFFVKPYNNGTDAAGNDLTSELRCAFADSDDYDSPKDAYTNIAIYSESDDGLAITSAQVQATTRSGAKRYYVSETSSEKTTDVTAYPVYATKYINLAAADLDGKTWKYTDVDGVAVNAVNTTEYYIVSKTGIKYFTGYTNVPTIKASEISAIYAVAENTSANNDKADYWVADVVVIELNNKYVGNYDSISLAYYNTQKSTGDVRSISVLDNVATEPATTAVPKDKTTWAGDWDSYGFYELYNTTTDEDGVITAGSITAIPTASTTDFNAYGIYAGIVNYTNKVNERGGYIVVDGKQVKVTNVPVYTLTNDRGVNTATKADSLTDVLAAGDKVIYVMNKAKTGVAYIVKVGDYKAPTTAATGLKDLYDEIVASQTTDIKVTFDGTMPTNDSTTPSAITVATSGSDVKLTGIAKDGYTVTPSVTAGTGNYDELLQTVSGDWYLTNVTGSVTVTLAYEAETYYITSTNTDNPELTVKVGENNYSALTGAHVGDVITVTYNPVANKTYTNAVTNEAGAVAMTTNAQGTIVFTMPASNVTVTATGADLKYSVTATGFTPDQTQVTSGTKLDDLTDDKIVLTSTATLASKQTIKVTEIKINGQTLNAAAYKVSVAGNAATITFQAPYLDVVVDGDIVITASVVTKTRDITITPTAVEVKSVKVGTTVLEASSGAYTADVDKDVVINVTVTDGYSWSVKQVGSSNVDAVIQPDGSYNITVSASDDDQTVTLTATN